MSLPFEFNWGVATAIEKLRPGATYQLVGVQIVNYKDSLGSTAPSWDEINTEMEKMYAAAVNK